MSARPRLLGRLLQGVVLGVLAFVALLQMVVMAGGATVFRYQGF